MCRLEKSKLKDCRITYASINIQFKAHDDLRGLSNSDKSQSLHANAFRFTENIHGETKCLNPNLNVLLMISPPIDDQGFVDGNVDEKVASCDKTECKFICSDHAARRLNMGTSAW